MPHNGLIDRNMFRRVQSYSYSTQSHERAINTQAWGHASVPGGQKQEQTEQGSEGRGSVRPSLVALRDLFGPGDCDLAQTVAIEPF
jgi:hypothetical protein